MFLFSSPVKGRNQEGFDFKPKNFVLIKMLVGNLKKKIVITANLSVHQKGGLPAAPTFRLSVFQTLGLSDFETNLHIINPLPKASVNTVTTAAP